MNCVFCEIVKGSIPCKIVAENEHALAFLDVNPLSDGHTIIITKKHYQYLSSVPVTELNSVVTLAKEVANILLDSKLKPWGINYLSNEGNIAGQEIMHFHMHVIPKYSKNNGFKMSAGNINVDQIDNVYETILKAK